MTRPLILSEAAEARPVRLQLSRKKGFDLQAHSLAINGLPAVKADRSTKLGNPFPVTNGTCDSTTGEAWVIGTWTGPAMWIRPTKKEATEISVAAYRAWITQPAQASVLANSILAARGKNLACWCGLDQPCHADVLLELANK